MRSFYLMGTGNIEKLEKSQRISRRGRGEKERRLKRTYKDSVRGQLVRVDTEPELLTATKEYGTVFNTVNVRR